MVFNSLGHSHDDILVAPMRMRFLAIAVYCAYVINNQFQYVGNAYIVDELSVYLGTSKTAINLLAAAYTVIYVFFAFPACEVFARMGLKTTLVLGLVINVAAALIKLVVVVWYREYWLFVIGQLLAGFAQLFCIAVPPLLAASWFPIDERSLATAVGTLSGFIGMALGFGIAPAIVNSDHNSPRDFHGLYGGQAAWAVMNLIVCVLFLPAHPEHPPSVTSPRYLAIVKERVESGVFTPPQRSDEEGLLNGAASGEAEPHTPSHIFAQVWALRTNTSFVVLVMTFGVGGGSLTAVSAVLSQIMDPYGVSASASGTITLVAILGGCVGCVVCGPLLDRYRAYKRPLIWLNVALLITLIGLLVLMAVVDAGGSTFVVIGYIFVLMIVVALLPTLPIGLELAVELTYPLDEAIPGTACFWSNAFFAMIGTVGATFLVGDQASKGDGLVLIGVVSVAIAICIVSLILWVSEDLRRLRHEQDEAVRKAPQRNDA